MYKRVDVYNEPRAILDEMKDSYCEMHPNEHGVLCGLIRKFLPKKIVEVGVAGGGYDRCNHEVSRTFRQ